MSNNIWYTFTVTKASGEIGTGATRAANEADLIAKVREAVGDPNAELTNISKDQTHVRVNFRE